MNAETARAEKMSYQTVKEVKARAAIPQPRSISEVSLDRILERELEKDAPKTGYPELDRIIKGFIPGHLYTLTGTENVGKTSLACNFAVRVSQQNKKVLYFALEPENQVVDYIASVRGAKQFSDLTNDDLQEDDGNIYIYGKQEARYLDDLVKIVEHSLHYDLIIIDHIGYFVTNLSNTYQDQSNTIKRLAGLARFKRCAIMMIAHLRKRGPNQKKDYKPTSDDIAGSGAFKQDSTEVMIVVRDLKDPQGDGMEYANSGSLWVTKTKCGPNGSIMLQFSERSANIMSIEEIIRRNAAHQALFNAPPVSSQEAKEKEDDETEFLDQTYAQNNEY